MKSKNAILVVLGFVVVAALILANRREGAPEEASQPAAQTQPQTNQLTAAPSEPATAAPASGAGTASGGSESSMPSAPSAAHKETQKVPHYHATLADAGPLPRILPATMFEMPIVVKAYKVAARIPEVLAQQPCYCWCDRMGHGSLVDCFATNHGAG